MAKRASLCWDRTNKQHYVRVTKDGKRVKRYLGRNRFDALKKFNAMIGGSTGLYSAPAPISVAKAAMVWEECHGIEKGDWAYSMATSWKKYAGIQPIAGLSTNHLVEYLEHLKADNQAAQTIVHKIKFAHRIIKWCMAQGWCSEVPEMPALPRPMKRPRDIPMDTLIEVFDKLSQNKRAGNAVDPLRFILFTGCRPGEACKLRWEDVNLDARECVLSQHKTSRSGKPRTIYLPDHAREILEGIKHRTGFVFLTRSNEPYTPSGLRSILRRQGINSVYSLRHTFAQFALESGTAIENVAKLLGHADLRTVQTYAQVRDTRARQAASNLVSPLPPPPLDGKHQAMAQST